MGFFSFKTNDTNESIPNRDADLPVFTVYMIDNKGNRWKESYYSGYGEFGGKDFYELLAEMNGKKTRNEGILLYFESDDENLIFPNLVRNIDNWEWKNEKPEDCEFQGFFYDLDKFLSS